MYVAGTAHAALGNFTKLEDAGLPGVTVRAAQNDHMSVKEPLAICLHIGDDDELDVGVFLRPFEVLHLADNLRSLVAQVMATQR